MIAAHLDFLLDAPFAEAHEDLRTRASALQALLTETPLPEQRLTWLGYLCLDLADFTEALARHFEREETDGEFHELLQHRPDLLARVSDLGAQHRGMLLTLDAVRTGLGELPLQEVTDRLLCLLERFELHEQDETEVVQLAYVADLGVGD